MDGTIVVASADLQVRARVERAAPDAVFTQPTGFSERLVEAALLVLDLDAGGQPAIDEAVAYAPVSDRPLRIVGFFSHIDDDLRLSAQGAGIEAYPRGRFWRDLPALLGVSDQQ